MYAYAYAYIYIYIYTHMCIYIYIYIYVAETVLVDLRARAARVCWCECTGSSTKKAPRRKYMYFLSGATRALARRYPWQPVRVNLLTWFLPTENAAKI